MFYFINLAAYHSIFFAKRVAIVSFASFVLLHKVVEIHCIYSSCVHWTLFPYLVSCFCYTSQDFWKSPQVCNVIEPKLASSIQWLPAPTLRCKDSLFRFYTNFHDICSSLVQRTHIYLKKQCTFNSSACTRVCMKLGSSILG